MCIRDRVVILTGAGGKAFVAGADISEMVDATPAEGRAMALLAMETFNKLCLLYTSRCE